ncbi:makorin, ring finger protein, 4 isoform X3 [Anarhichas minor]|uniref:makorin, ring finger protein, 4 isoform X3 n=1 Tax=Anarhichas minor TaxID=65739 RepID=UPI003F738C27
MEGDRNTRRMDLVRNASICRRFINGSCRLGPRCSYRHEWPAIPQICRYFQKGGCWYGERCRYLHVLPEVVAAVAGRRGSVPTVSSSVAYTPPDRRGSEPALLQADVLSRPAYNGPQLVVNISNPPHNTGLLAADIAEEQAQDTNTPLTASWESVQSSEAVQACAREGRNEQETSNETMEDGAAAAAFSIRGNMEEMDVFLRSQNVTCGICMDKVYEKTDPRNHVFGILPNCNHSFCLQCIMTWRKTKDLGPDVVNKKRCNYYTRYRCCPFKTECLYRHDKHAPRGSFPYYTEDEDYDGVDLINLFVAMTVLRDHNAADDDEDDGFPFYLSEEYGF